MLRLGAERTALQASFGSMLRPFILWVKRADLFSGSEVNEDVHKASNEAVDPVVKAEAENPEAMLLRRTSTRLAVRSRMRVLAEDLKHVHEVLGEVEDLVAEVRG